MGEYKHIILMLLSMVMLVEMVIKTIPDKNSKNGGSRFAKITYRKSSVLIAVAMFSFMTMAVAIIFITTLLDDGPFIFNDEKFDLNSSLNGGEIPEAAEYVTVRFNTVGEPFYPEGRDGVYYPVIIYDDSGSNSIHTVMAIHVNDSDKSILDKYIWDKNNSPDTMNDISDSPMLEYTGRLLLINKYSGLYEQTIRDSGMFGKSFKEEKLVIDATVNKDDIKNQLIFMGIIFFGCLISDIVIILIWKKRTNKNE